MRIVHDRRVFSLGLCLVLLLSSGLIGELLVRVAGSAGLPSVFRVFKVSVSWAGFVTAALFLAFFYAFSKPAEQ